MFNNLSSAQMERLFLLAEELCEAGQAIQKLLRHGPNSYNPDSFDDSRTNKEDLERELGHVMARVELLDRAGDVDWDEISRWERRKTKQENAYLHHQGEGEREVE